MPRESPEQPPVSLVVAWGGRLRRGSKVANDNLPVTEMNIAGETSLTNACTIFEALSSPVKLQIVAELVRCEPFGLNAWQVAEVLKLHHRAALLQLTSLSRSGLVCTIPSGQYTHYRVCMERLLSLETVLAARTADTVVRPDESVCVFDIENCAVETPR